ncbi:MAG: HD domain-containing protein [Acidobacteriota bacterium]
MTASRLQQQLRFILEIDRLKGVLRQTTLADGSRRENSAEHSWHITLMAFLLTEHAVSEELSVQRVMEMLLVHDLVEIDAGDTFCYDREAHRDKEEREQRAADRLFGLLPADQGERFRALWDEFEAGETLEARYAAALDRLQPVLLNLHSEGSSWRRHGIRRHQVWERNRPIGDGAPEIWSYIEEQLDLAVEAGRLKA